MLPGSAAVKTPRYEGGGTGSFPGPEAKIPHASGQLILGVTTRKDTCTSMKTPQDGTKDPTGCR